MVLGALIAEEDQARLLDAKLQHVKEQWRAGNELKWGKVSRTKLDVYEAFVTAGLSSLRRDAPGYYAIVVDTAALDHNRYNDGSSEIGFSKFIYQLLLKCARLFHFGSNLDCFLDDRTTRQSLDELRRILNNGASKAFRARPVRRVEYRDSKDTNIIQLVDLLTGAVAYHWNGNDKADGASPARVWLASHIARGAGMSRLDVGTAPGRDRFSVWKFAASPRSKSPRGA
jgi:hypothetical protein